MAWLPELRRERTFRNREGEAGFDVTLRRATRPGASALVRIRNEARKIETCLGSILPSFDEIVVVDNGSDDETVALVTRFKERADPSNKIQIHSYPFRLARFGPEHEGVAADSVRSAVHFSNWALSHCTRTTVCKWDGDMVLLKAAREAFDRVLRRGRLEVWAIAGQTIYRDLSGDLWEAIGEVNREVEIFPNGWGCRFEKRRHWERLARPRLLPRHDLESVVFAELKFVDEDEFDHWSTTDWPSPRKRREWENFQAVREGRLDSRRFRRLPRGFLDDQLA
ncbi:MAG: glycosyltransferase [Gemmatimonadetes bacterium]|nr:glycosyltransferase [Gemmatimonadota bacterium]